MSFGGKSFTDALAQHLRIDPIEAERTKIARGGLTTEERGVLHESVRPLAGIAGQFFGLLESSLRYASTQTGTKLPELSRIVLLGGGMRLRGMETFLSRGFGVPAGFFAPPALRIASPASQQAAREISERPSDFGLALGLAAAGLRDGGQQGPVKSCVSVVPAAYVERRVFRERTLFLYAAGAILLVALILRFAHGYLRNSEARAVQRDLAATASRLEGLKKELDDMTVATEVRKARLNRLLQEAEQTSFQAYMLDLLSRVLRPEMQLQRVFLEDGMMTREGTSSDYMLHIEGRVSNEKQQGIEWISSLQRLLREEERIGSVEEVPADSDRIWRNFKLLVKPNYIRY